MSKSERCMNKIHKEAVLIEYFFVICNFIMNILIYRTHMECLEVTVFTSLILMYLR